MKELIDGLLLGDGHLAKQAKNARYAHSCKHKEYIEYLMQELGKQNIIVNHIYEKDNGYKTGKVYQCYSLTNTTLTIHHSRWYTNRKKNLPNDLQLTPTILLHWYIGDGTFDTCQGYLRQISIAAHSFSIEERIRLCDQLSKLGLKVRNSKRGNIHI